MMLGAHAKSNTFSTPRQRHKKKSNHVGALLPNLTKRAFEKFGFPASALVTDWATIIGQDLASFTAPERLKWPHKNAQFLDENGTALDADNKARQVSNLERKRSGAILVLRAEGPRALEIQFAVPQIIERINMYFGYCAVTDIRILQAPIKNDALNLETLGLAAEKPQSRQSAKRFNDVADPKLRASFMRMAQGIEKRQKEQELKRRKSRQNSRFSSSNQAA